MWCGAGAVVQLSVQHAAAGRRAKGGLCCLLQCPHCPACTHCSPTLTATDPDQDQRGAGREVLPNAGRMFFQPCWHQSLIDTDLSMNPNQDKRRFCQHLAEGLHGPAVTDCSQTLVSKHSGPSASPGSVNLCTLFASDLYDT